MESSEQNQQIDRVYIIAEAHEILVLRILLRQAMPMLKRPEDYGKDRRRDLAHTIGLTLDGMDASFEESEHPTQQSPAEWHRRPLRGYFLCRCQETTFYVGAVCGGQRGRRRPGR
jgi:hypothetical protein